MDIDPTPVDFVEYFVTKHRLDELVLQIFEYMTPYELCVASTVSSSWRILSSHEYLWKVLSFRHYAVVEDISLHSIHERYSEFNLAWKEVYARLYLQRRRLCQLAGRFHSAVIIDGRLVLWGQSAKWLSIPFKTDSNAPVIMPKENFDNEALFSVSVHYAHTIAATQAGNVFVWGRGESGECASLSRKNFVHPRKVAGFGTLPIDGSPPVHYGRVVNVSAGYVHMAAVTENGGLYTWGCCASGRLGHGLMQVDQLEPRQVEAVKNDIIVSVCCGGASTLALSKRGQVYYCGTLCEFSSLSPSSVNAEDGLPDTCYTPVLLPVFNKRRAVSVSVGDQHALVVTSDGALWSWGLGSVFRLGHGDLRTVPEPKFVSSLSQVRISAASAGFAHSACVSAGGELFTWGWGQNGQNGHNIIEDVRLPRVVSALQGVIIVSVSCGYLHTLALSVSGNAYTWGDNTHSQLGHGCSGSPFAPTTVPYHLVTLSNCWWKAGHGMKLIYP